MKVTKNDFLETTMGYESRNLGVSDTLDVIDIIKNFLLGKIQFDDYEQIENIITDRLFVKEINSQIKTGENKTQTIEIVEEIASLRERIKALESR